MTVADTLSGLSDFGRRTGKEQVDLIVYALSTIEGKGSVKPSDVVRVYDDLDLPKYGRIPQYLSEQVKAARGKKPRYLKKDGGYRLSQPVADECALALPLRKTKPVVAKKLNDLLPLLPTSDAQNYLEEALGCFTSGYLRACIVMTWCLTYDLFRDWLLANHLPALNRQCATWKIPATITALDDLDGLNERTLLDTANKAGILSKELYKSLVQLLDDRNSYAHASGKPITESIAEAYIERAVHHVIAELK